MITIQKRKFKQPITTTGTIVSLGSVPQKLMKVNVSGNTVTPVYSNVCDVTTGFSVSSGALTVDATTKTYGTASIKNTASSTDANAYITTNITNTKYYLLSAWLKNNNCTNVRLSAYQSNAITNLIKDSTATTGTTWTRVGLLLQPSELSGLTQITISIRATSANTQTFNFDGINLIEITASEHALGLTAMMNKYPFIDGTKSTIVNSVKVVGKNLFNPSYEQGGIDGTNGTTVPGATRVRTGYIKVKPNTTYMLSVANNFVRVISGYNNNSFSQLILDVVQTKTHTFTTNASTTQIRISFCKTNLSDNMIPSEMLADSVMLEYGSTATTYEAYKEQVATLPSTPLTLTSGQSIDLYLLAQPSGSIVADVPVDGTSTVPTLSYALKNNTATTIVGDSSTKTIVTGGESSD